MGAAELPVRPAAHQAARERRRLRSVELRQRQDYHDRRQEGRRPVVDLEGEVNKTPRQDPRRVPSCRPMCRRIPYPRTDSLGCAVDRPRTLPESGTNRHLALRGWIAVDARWPTTNPFGE